MGNCLSPASSTTETRDLSMPLPAPIADIFDSPAPIDVTFKLPSPPPSWPRGGGFATGAINLGGGLQVCQVSTFNKIFATREGGPDDLGATFYEPTALPPGYLVLGCYAQPNNKPLFGWVLAAKDDGNALRMPIDYKLVWTSEKREIEQDGVGYIWLPVPPKGYTAVGHVVTNWDVKPPLDKIRCVRSDLTETSQVDECIWSNGGISIYDLKPSKMDTQATGVRVGTFVAQVDGVLALPCLTNKVSNKTAAMPNLSQIQALMRTYSPFLHIHPDDPYLPSTVKWFFSNGALLYKRGNESNPVRVDPTGSNLPQGGQTDDTYSYWLDLPTDAKEKERVKKGDLSTSGAYYHVKSMLGGTFTDLAVWYFFPFNGGARVKLAVGDISLGKFGEHVGDWEHVTLRISNMTGELWRVFFAQHNKGTWVDASQLEFQSGNKFAVYSSMHGHASYPEPGLVLQGGCGFGLRNDTAKSKYVMDTGVRCEVVSAEHLGNGVVVEPAWLNFNRGWGPKIDYDLGIELQNIEKDIPALKNIIKKLPHEMLGEEGPTGPKLKKSWSGDEV